MDGQNRSGSTFVGSALWCQGLHCFEGSQALPTCTSGNLKMNIAWGIGGMMTGKSLHRCHFVHLKTHMNWLGIRTWAPAVRGKRLTTWVQARSTDESREVPIRTSEGKKTLRLGFPHGTVSHVSFRQLCICVSPYCSNCASLCPPPHQ
jgi:hypothetical protein